MRVAIYIRVSTEHDEQTSSLENQEGGALEAVHRNGWTIFDIYQERQSGLRLDKRTEFMRLMADARSRKFDIVWVKSLTRYGRKIADLHKYVEELVRLDIRFVAEIEGIDTHQSDWSTKLGMWAMFAQWESQGLSDRIRFALEVKAGRGEYMGSLPPYGYDVNDKRLMIATDGSDDIVRRIYSLYLSGIGPSSIASILSAERIPTPHQRLGIASDIREWQENTVRKILLNPVYTGKIVSHKETTKVLGDTRRIPIPDEDWLMVNGDHPPLIWQTDFDAVQRRMQSCSRKRPFRPHAHLFSNLLYCADCGARMYCISRQWGRVHYVCGRYIKSRRRQCSRHTVYEDALSCSVLAELQRAVSPSTRQSHEVETEAKKRMALEKKLAKLHNRQTRAQDLYLDGQLSRPEYHRVLERIDGQLRSMTEELTSLNRDWRHREKLPDRERDQILEFTALTPGILIRYVRRIEIATDGNIHAIKFTFS